MKTNMFTRFCAAALVIAAVACQQVELDSVQTPGATSENLVPITITASLEPGTKAALQSDGKVNWEAGDVMTVLSVSVTDEAETVTSYDFTTTEGGQKAEFSGLVGEETVNLASGMYGVYPPTTKEYHPYLYGTSYSGFTHTVSSGSLQMFLPSTQFASADAAGLYSLSAGKAELDEEQKIRLTMKNVGGLIAITLPDLNITSVTLYGNANEQIAGVVTATFDENGIPVVSSVEGSNMIRIVPKKKGTFTAGTYYINVPPMTFASGLTLVFTNDENKYATLKSTSAFVVERSMVSSFPAITALNFGGKYLDWTYSNDYTVNSGVGVSIKYCKDGDGEYNDALPSSGSTLKGLVDAMSNSTDGYKIKLNASSWIRANSGTSGGLCMCGAAGAYIAFPSIDGYVLNKVSVRSGNSPGIATAAGQCMTTTPDADGNYQILSGCSPVDYGIYSGMDNLWSFNGDSYTGELPIALTMTQATNANQGVRFHAIRLYYAEAAAEGLPSVNPTVVSVVAQPDVDYVNTKITLKGQFEAIDYSSLSQFTCGFEYKPGTASDWTSVSATRNEMQFSASEITLDTRPSEFIYRPWVKYTKTDGSVKTVYGGEAVIDLTKVVLNLVFNDSYWDRTAEGKNANFLSREWGWATNQNNSSAQKPALGEMNGKSYDFNYQGEAYPFTFYSLQGIYYDKSGVSTLSPGGYTLRVASESQTTYGLCMNYINSNTFAGPYPAWMQFPGVEKFKLTQVKATLYSKQGFKIASAVVTDENAEDTVRGTAVENAVLAQATNTYNATLALEGTAAGQRYYLCTTQNRVTFKNLTLTYEFASE